MSYKQRMADQVMAALPSAPNDKVEAMCEHLRRVVDNGEMPESLADDVSVLLRKQAAHVANAVAPVASEPVAWMFRYRGRFGNVDWTDWTPMKDEPVPMEGAETESYPLYAHPPVAPAASEWIQEAMRLADDYADQSRRQQVGMPSSKRAALHDALSKALGLTAQSAEYPIPATSESPPKAGSI